MELPKVISVDDHVVEPAHVWQTWLPEKFREQGPRVERADFGAITRAGGATYNQEIVPDGEGTTGDYWVYEDRLIYVQKSFVAIPLGATPGGDVTKFDRTSMQMVPITYDEMRPGCYDPKARLDDMDMNWVEASLPFPTFPRFCGQTFLESTDKELGLACVRAYNDWMVEEWCGPYGGRHIPLCLIPLWDVDLAIAEVQRNAARGVRAVCFSEIPAHLGLPSIHTGYWDPFFAACADTSTTVCMHIGSSSRMPVASPDAPPSVPNALAFNNSIASLIDFLFSGVLVRHPTLKLAYSESQIGWIPYALERADTTWELHNAWTRAKDAIPEPPSTYYYGRVFGCFTTDVHGMRSIDEIGPDNVCFEVDYPHTDTSWPWTKEMAEKLVANLDDDLAYKVLRGNAIRMLDLDLT
jgi:predicted TIM-barrel fold metal-dependent hydrolase